jgi:hypothetical protein
MNEEGKSVNVLNQRRIKSRRDVDEIDNDRSTYNSPDNKSF